MGRMPQYRELYEKLREDIDSGRYVSGDLLPSENELSLYYRITRPTVRKALGQLVADGYIVKYQGKGSIVKGAPKGIGILALSGTTSAVGKDELSTEIVVKPELRTWSEAFGFPLHEREQKYGCVYFERLRRLNGVPMFFDVTMLPNVDLPNFLGVDLRDRSLFDFLRSQYQIEVKGGTQQIFAIKADRRLQDFFNVKAGFPVLQLNRKIETSREGFHIYSQIFCVTQGYGLTGTF